MQILKIMSTFSPPINDLKQIYIMYIRSCLEQSSVVWSTSLTKENILDLERVQKNALRIILKQNYMTYHHALEYLNMQTLEDRRVFLLKKFTLKNMNNKYFSEYFKYNKKTHDMRTRKSYKYEMLKNNTERYKKSTIPAMQRLINRKLRIS